MRAAIELVIHYSAVVTDSFSFRCAKADRRPSSSWTSAWLRQRARRSFVLDFARIRQVGQALTGELEYDARPGDRRSRVRGGVRARRGALPTTVNRLLFDASRLSLPHNMHDPAAMRLGIELCEKELGTLGRASALRTRTRPAVGRSPRLSLARAIAEALHVSTRTLKRRLAGEDTSYRQLLDDERREQALSLLAAPELSLSQIAVKLWVRQHRELRAGVSPLDLAHAHRI